MSNRMSLYTGVGLLAVAMAISPMIAAPAPGVKSDPKSDTESTATMAEKVRKALDTTHTFEYKDQNLAAIIPTLAEHFKIPIVLDRNAINFMGMLPDEMMVEINLKNVKLRTALRNILASYNMTYVYADGALLITSEDTALSRQLKQRIDLNFDNVPIQTAMKELSSKYGINILFDPKVIKAKTSQNPVSIQLDEVQFEAAVRLMCEMADLKPARMGNVIFITTEARADKLKDSDSLVPPPPAVPNPFGPGANFGFAGNLGFAGGIPAPAVGVAPAVVDKAEVPAKDPPAKE